MYLNNASRKDSYFQERLAIGKQAEKMVKHHYKKNFVLLTGNKHSYDGILTQDGISKNVEIKVFSSTYETFFAEIYQNTNKSQIDKNMSDYLKESNQVDLVYQVDPQTGDCYIFDNLKLRPYVLARKDKAFTAKDTRNNAKGLKIKLTDEEAGFIEYIKLKPVPKRKSSKPKAKKSQCFSFSGLTPEYLSLHPWLIGSEARAAEEGPCIKYFFGEGGTTKKIQIDKDGNETVLEIIHAK